MDDGNWKLAWDKFRSGTPAEIVDEHYYRPPDWFLEHSARYDSYDRKGPKVFAGEFAAHRKDKASTLDAAVCEAAFMTGLLRNADVVTMSCYAPLLAREGFVQWTPDLIWFDATRVMPTPSYHIQAMYGKNRPDRMLPSVFENNTAQGEGGGPHRSRHLADAGRVQGRGRQGWQQASCSGRAKAWTTGSAKSGQWSAEDGVLKQTGNDEGAIALAGDPSWTDYTLSLKARKTGGREGFLILFRSADEKDRCWWNIGGWGNTGHALEIKGYESPRVRGKIETDAGMTSASRPRAAKSDVISTTS